MNVKRIKAKGKEYPVKFNKWVQIAWENSTGLLWSDIIPSVDPKTKEIIPPKVKANIEQDLKISLEMLREGYRIENKDFNMSLRDLAELCEGTDFEGQISKVLTSYFTGENTDTEKKQTT